MSEVNHNVIGPNHMSATTALSLERLLEEKLASKIQEVDLLAAELERCKKLNTEMEKENIGLCLKIGEAAKALELGINLPDTNRNDSWKKWSDFQVIARETLQKLGGK